MILNKSKVQLKPIPLGKITTNYRPKGGNKKNDKAAGMISDAK